MDATAVEALSAIVFCPVALGFILDSLLGDPLWLPHPVRWFGKMIAKGDEVLNQGKNKVLKGALLVVLLTGVIYVSLWTIEYFFRDDAFLFLVFESVMVFFGIANRNLISEAMKVERKLSGEGIEAGRKQLSWIVGRDTRNLSANKIRIATLETLSENLSDGVVAPLFYYAIGGVPLMLTYKMINTMDSMLGYKNDKYFYFGKVAAKLDDVVNYIPARITALLMVAITFSWRGMKYIFQFGNKHASPNAGYPEAALAGILNCRFGGPNYYHGKLVEKPFIGVKERDIAQRDLRKTCTINFMVSLVCVALIVILKEQVP